MKHKNFFLSLLLIIIPFINQAQVDVQIITEKIDTVEIQKYKFSGLGRKQAFIRMGYSDYKIKNPKIFKLLKTKKIQSIELLFTDYPEGAEMSKLNEKRFISLYLHFPEVFDNTDINWTLVKQTDANHRNVYSFYHGFAVTWGDKLFTKRATRERKHLEDVIAGKKEVEDSTVLKVMDRNKHWKNMLIIGDFTGSMTPYIAEVLLWHKLNLKRKNVNGFVFFNDGDSTSNFNKKIGKTGGLYPAEAKNFRQVLETAIITMANGDGGDSGNHSWN